MVSQDAEFQTAATQIGNAAGGRFRAQSGKHRFPAETGFFLRADDFQSYPCGLLDAADERATVLGFARGAGGHGAILGDAKFFHDFVEMAKGFHTLFENFLDETMADKNTFAKAQRIAFSDERFNIEARISAGNRQADCIGAGVDGGDVNGLWHGRGYRQRWASAEEGVYLVARMPRCSPTRWRSCLLTVETLASPSSSIKALRLAMTSNSRLIMVW